MGALVILSLSVSTGCQQRETNLQDAAAKQDAALSDSLSTAFGHWVGADMNLQFKDFTSEQKEVFLSALRQVFGYSGDSIANEGAALGGQLLTAFEQYKQHENIDFNVGLVYEGIRKVFMIDSMSREDDMQYREDFSKLRQHAGEIARERRLEELRNSPEARQNEQSSADFLANIKAQDSTIQTTASGLCYKIDNPGHGDKPGDNATVMVKYVGKHITGKVFDASGDQAHRFNLRGIIPGFREGLQLLGTGGKATLYIPAELGYGVEGQPQAGISSNELLIFDVELVEIK